MSNTQTKITLFDFPTTLPNGAPISPFAARVRYVLNYKQLAYRIQFIEYFDIESISKQHGFKPTGERLDGSLKYTIPAILDETSSDNTIALSDSTQIILYLDSAYPTPSRLIFPSASLSPTSEASPAPAIHLLAQAYFMHSVVSNFRPLLLPHIYRAQTPKSREKWLRYAIGKPTVEEGTPQPGTQEYNDTWKRLRIGFEGLAAFFEQNHPDGEKEGDRVWIMGDQPTFVDFVILSHLMLAKLVSPDEVWKEVGGMAGGRWERYVRAGERYMTLPH